MLPLLLGASTDQHLTALALGSHPDDIEIGAGGTLLQLADNWPLLRVHYVVFTGTPERQNEARRAASAFLPSTDVSVEMFDLPEGRLPVHWADVKTILENVARSTSADFVLAPALHDAHQDHRTLAEIVPTVFRDILYLAYEIPKWDGDMWRPSIYVPLPIETIHRKLELLDHCFPSQRHKRWWNREVFLGMARLRGMECCTAYAEAFGCTKAVIGTR
jgi:LmbE family N-acetylglucosaminyl deacetylase